MLHSNTVESFIETVKTQGAFMQHEQDVCEPPIINYINKAQRDIEDTMEFCVEKDIHDIEDLQSKFPHYYQELIMQVSVTDNGKVEFYIEDPDYLAQLMYSINLCLNKDYDKEDLISFINQQIESNFYKKAQRLLDAEWSARSDESRRV